MLHGTSYDPSHSRQVVTIEKTAKKFKAHKVLAFLGLAGCIIAGVAQSKMEGDAAVNAAWWTLGAVFCGVWYVLTLIRIWWNHG
jgi:hypothetical protein